jgi:hypothetical protein
VKRFSLSLAALATLATLTACGGESDDGADSGSSSSAPASSDSETATSTDESEPADPSEVTGSNYAVAYGDVTELFASLGDADAPPTNTEEANAAAGLDETSDLLFADYTLLPEDPDAGSFCLLSAPTGTYVAVTYDQASASGEVNIGDGECSYDTANAVVVGDLTTDEWTVGAEKMGEGQRPLEVVGG